MEKLDAMEQKRIIGEELTQGRELANQLKNHLGAIASNETREHLVQNILSSYDKALVVLINWKARLQEPSSIVDSTESVNIVRIRSGKGVLPPDDGYIWRKYGKKDILGSKYPREYYQCTHRHTKGCIAKKQVQRSDEDPSILEVTYRGRHCCIGGSQSPPEEGSEIPISLEISGIADSVTS